MFLLFTILNQVRIEERSIRKLQLMMLLGTIYYYYKFSLHYFICLGDYFYFIKISSFIIIRTGMVLSNKLWLANVRIKIFATLKQNIYA